MKSSVGVSTDLAFGVVAQSLADWISLENSSVRAFLFKILAKSETITGFLIEQGVLCSGVLEGSVGMETGTGIEFSFISFLSTGVNTFRCLLLLLQFGVYGLGLFSLIFASFNGK